MAANAVHSTTDWLNITGDWLLGACVTMLAEYCTLSSAAEAVACQAV
jgi:hypothetical protein